MAQQCFSHPDLATGASVHVPLSDPSAESVGGGLTLAADTPLFQLCSDTWIGPLFRLDLYGSGFNSDVQLNQIGNLVDGDREGDTVVGLTWSPGLLCRCGITDNTNAVVFGSGVVGLRTSDTKASTFDPSRTQLQVEQFETTSDVTGFSAGGGFEYQLPSERVVRSTVTVGRHQHDLFTGQDRWETNLMVTVEMLSIGQPRGRSFSRRFR